MGLFDNLFLDQNTPVTINDGVDHSKDVVTPVLEPDKVAAGGGSAGSGGTSDDTSSGAKGQAKKDDGFGTLFTADNAAEKAALAVLHPEPPKDIALEIGLAPSDTSDTIGSVPTDATSPDVSFDIGGDLDFDIGGDIMGTPVAVIGSDVSQNGADISIVSSEGTPGDLTPNVEITPQEIITVDASIPSTTTPSDTALFSIFNEDATAIDTSESPTSQEVSSTIVDDALEESSVFSDLSHLSDPDVSPIPTIDTPVTFVSEDASEADLSLSGIAPLGSMTGPSDISTDTSSIREQLRNIPLPGSSKLKSKLEEFISELHNLDAEDQAVREAKRNQIAVYQARVDELKAENEARIHALEFEKADLLKEIQEMDNEKNHIQEVITAFKKELEAV